MHLRHSIVCAFLILGEGCAAQQQDSYEARMRVADRSTMTSAERFVDQQEGEEKSHVADYDHRIETWKSPFQAYAECNKDASRAAAAQIGDSASLAVAARNLCRKTEANLRKAVYAAYEDNPEFGVDAMEKLRGAILKNDARDIVAARAAAAAPRRPSGPEASPVDRRI
jgi:hypothetical protein